MRRHYNLRAGALPQIADYRRFDVDCIHCSSSRRRTSAITGSRRLIVHLQKRDTRLPWIAMVRTISELILHKSDRHGESKYTTETTLRHVPMNGPCFPAAKDQSCVHWELVAVRH